MIKANHFLLPCLIWQRLNPRLHGFFCSFFVSPLEVRRRGDGHGIGVKRSCFAYRPGMGLFGLRFSIRDGDRDGMVGRQTR